MIQNSPTIRRVLYLGTVVAAVGAIALRHTAPQWSDTLNEIALYLAGITGWTASSNLSGPGVDASKPIS